MGPYGSCGTLIIPSTVSRPSPHGRGGRSDGGSENKSVWFGCDFDRCWKSVFHMHSFDLQSLGNPIFTYFLKKSGYFRDLWSNIKVFG